MKVQIDTQAKTIKVEELVNLEEFMTTVKKLFPGGEWKEYSLVTGTVINYWQYPWTVWQPTVSPSPWVTTNTEGTSHLDTPTVYCLEVVN